MIQRRGGARLALESLQGLVIVRKTFGQKLERHHPAEPGVLGLIHDTHPAATELLENATVGNRFADHGSRSRRHLPLWVGAIPDARRGVAPDIRQRRQIAPVYFKTSSRAYLVPTTSRYLLRS